MSASAQVHSAPSSPQGEEALALLMALIREPSFSGHEKKTADLIHQFLTGKGVRVLKSGNNLYAFNRHFDKTRHTLLICSHHDTAKPLPELNSDPFVPKLESGRISGLGSCESGASLVGLLFSFLEFYEMQDLAYNLLFVASAEGLTAGKNGLQKVLCKFDDIACAIVGKPTGLCMAVAERGCMEVECHLYSKEDAIGLMLKDLLWLRSKPFARRSALLGEVEILFHSLQATGVKGPSGSGSCSFVLEIQSNEIYSNEMIQEVLEKNLNCFFTVRNKQRFATLVPEGHFFYSAATEAGIATCGSLSPSDKALIPAPTIKIGPGTLSAGQQESVSISDLYEGIRIYSALLRKILVS